MTSKAATPVAPLIPNDGTREDSGPGVLGLKRAMGKGFSTAEAHLQFLSEVQQRLGRS